MEIADKEHVALWEAINALVIASGGKDITNNARMEAVVGVESALQNIISKESVDSKDVTKKFSKLARRWKRQCGRPCGACVQQQEFAKIRDDVRRKCIKELDYNFESNTEGADIVDSCNLNGNYRFKVKIS